MMTVPVTATGVPSALFDIYMTCLVLAVSPRGPWVDGRGRITSPGLPAGSGEGGFALSAHLPVPLRVAVWPLRPVVDATVGTYGQVRNGHNHSTVSRSPIASGAGPAVSRSLPGR